MMKKRGCSCSAYVLRSAIILSTNYMLHHAATDAPRRWSGAMVNNSSRPDVQTCVREHAEHMKLRHIECPPSRRLWSSASSGDIGVIGKYSNAKKSADKLSKKIEKAPKKEREKLEDLLKNRNARVCQHKAHADRQIKIFEKNGLIKPITVKTQQDNPEDPDSPIETTTTKYQIAGGPDQLRGILAANMPTLKYGTEFSGILNASLQTNSDKTMETIHMQRQGAGSGVQDGFDSGLPLTVKPVTLSIDTFGCPYINFGQQFFVDFQTNTTIDDIYAVSGVSHSLSPTEFKSSIKLTPLNKLGQYRNLQDQFDDAVAVSDAIGETSE